MKHAFFCILFLFSGLLVRGGESPELLEDGTLILDGWRGTLTAFTADWHTLQPSSAPNVFRREEWIPGKLLRYRLTPPGATEGVLMLSLGQDRFKGEARFGQPSQVNSLCLQSALLVSLYGGTAFEVDGKRMEFPEKYQDGEAIYDGRARRLRLPGKTGEILYEGDFHLRIQDGRKWSGATYGMRLGFLPYSGKIAKTQLDFRIRHGKAGEFGAALGSISRPPYVAAPNEEWRAFEYHRNALPGSALDFSGRLDAPAGKYGPVIAGADGRFVFRGRPDVPVRFYGANFVGDSQLPDRKQAEELADRMAALGFNAVRIHHHDNEVYDRSGKSPSRINPERMDRLHYFLACLKKRGIYYTTDVYVSRRQIPASELGAIGAIATPEEYKGLFYVNDEVYADWERWARAFFGMVNPYTGLALKDDPALIALSLVNEGNPSVVWDKTPRVEKLYQEKFAEWKKSNPEGTFERFLSELTEKRYAQMKAFLDKLGNSALLTDQNFYTRPELSVARAKYDFVANNTYWDHPKFAEKRWQLPVLPGQSNVLAIRPGTPGSVFPARLFGKGFVITEFDYANPNIYRAVGPVLMASYAAFQDWDGLFPFAYAHSLASVVNPERTSGFFDISTDPVKAFSQRIGARLFLAGGIAPAKNVFAAVVTDPFRADSAKSYPSSFCDLGFLARVGSTATLPAPCKVDGLIDIGSGTSEKGAPVVRGDDALIDKLISNGLLPKGCYDAATGRFTAPGGQLELNRSKQTLRVTAPGGEVLAMEAGLKLQGKHLTVENNGPFSVFALLPVDSTNIADAKRLTLMHLTNTQASGMTFGNDRLDRLESWGTAPFLARHGKARISLRDIPGDWTVYPLDTAGRRIGNFPAAAHSDGSLTLELDNFRWPEAVFAYELVREGK